MRVTLIKGGIVMSKNPYEELKAEIRDTVKKSRSSRYSRSDQVKLTQTLLNTPDHEVPVYVSDPDNPVVTKPVQDYRESLKDVVKQFGVDDAELDKIQDVKFSKAHAEAFNNLSAVAMKDYAGTGRKLVLPINAPNESQMELSVVEKAEKSEDTRKLEQNADGSYSSVPTGKRKTTASHTELKASNKIPGWLIEQQDL